mgnify:CR=1 FL=1
MQKMGSGTILTKKKGKIVDYFLKKNIQKEIKLIKNNCESNIIDFYRRKIPR